MADTNIAAEAMRKRILDPVERVSGMLFGLFMALISAGRKATATATPRPNSASRRSTGSASAPLRSAPASMGPRLREGDL